MRRLSGNRARAFLAPPGEPRVRDVMVESRLQAGADLGLERAQCRERHALRGWCVEPGKSARG